jgi:transcriptional regulator with XRE-family HTH domain
VALRVVPTRARARKIVGDAIREQRKTARLSQEKLAEKADLHPNYIGEVERGEKTISVDALLRIASALKVSISTFFPGL